MYISLTTGTLFPLQKDILPYLRDVVIIGMSVKVPGANSLQKYWNLLVNGKCVIQEAPEDRWAIETHGTGTPIGDPIEMEGMVQGFRSFTDKKGFCAIGSLLQSLKITPSTILSEGTGTIAGAALMGLISSNESQIIDRLISFGQKLRPEICAEFVNKGETCLYCGNSGTIKDRIGIQNEPHLWIAIDINTAKISSPKIRVGRQTPNETGTSNVEPTPLAKVSSRGLVMVKVDMGISETWAPDSDRLARPRLIRIDKLASITENQRRLSREALSNDLLIQDSRG